MSIRSAEELTKHPEMKEALVELLYQLADDDFILSYRGAEWLGLCPHIEEDVAYSSITQNTMGHAAMYYQLLEELGEGSSDALAHERKASERKNAILLERVNGPGTYLVEPDYDWAFTVVRNYFYEAAKRIRLASLRNCSYAPLANVSRSISGEQYYHLKHWEVWFRQLMTSTPIAREKMEAQIERVWKDFGGVLTLGSQGDKMTELGFISDENIQIAQWVDVIEKMFNEVNYKLPSTLPQVESGNGRDGSHTPDLQAALDTLGEVYHSDKAATW